MAAAAPAPPAAPPPDEVTATWRDFRRDVVVRAVVGLIGAGAVYAVLWAAADLLIGGVIHAGRGPTPDPPAPSFDEVARVAAGAALLAFGLLLAAVAAWRERTYLTPIVASVVIVYALYLAGSIPDQIKRFTADPPDPKDWPTGDQAAFASGVASEVLMVVLVIAVLIVATRSYWAVFLPALLGTMVLGAVLLGGVWSFRQPFEHEPDPDVGQLTITGKLVGADLVVGNDVSVVFVIQTRDKDGAVTATTQTTRPATVGTVGDCEDGDEEGPKTCSVGLLVERGDKDATLGAWLADMKAARSEIWIIGPTGVPPSAAPPAPASAPPSGSPGG